MDQKRVVDGRTPTTEDTEVFDRNPGISQERFCVLRVLRGKTPSLPAFRSLDWPPLDFRNGTAPNRKLLDIVFPKFDIQQTLPP